MNIISDESENKQCSDTVDNSYRIGHSEFVTQYIPQFSSSFVADEIVGRYNNILKRQTPRVGTTFCPNNEPLSGVQCKDSVLDSSTKTFCCNKDSSLNEFLLTFRSKTTGLDKYKKYIEARTGSKSTDTNMSNLEGRSIVGQEDRQLLRRPPAVGQASSSSDSGSIIMDRHSPVPESDINNSSDEDPLKEFSVSKDINSNPSRDFELDEHRVRALANRDDFINERPPEGSSEQESIASAPDLQSELPRVPSPSSASSAASFRPLEWDSGADVGYYQLYPDNNPETDNGLSTIERIALARGSAALLTRSDPEGTTEHTAQIPGTVLSNKPVKTKINLKTNLGTPVAESTPFTSNLTTCTFAAEGSQSESEEFSAIVEHPARVLNINKVLSCEKVEIKEETYSKNPSKEYSLFPELLHNNKATNQPDVNSKTNNGENNSLKSTNYQSVGKLSGCMVLPSENKDVQLHSLHKHFSAPDANYVETADNTKKYTPSRESLSRNVKLLSSSMEILNMKSNTLETERVTLPRSHSHNNIANDANINSLPKSLILRSFAPAKSASSSSVSTVVHKKRDSPKRTSKLVQTSFLSQSVGTQVTGSDCLYISTKGNLGSEIFSSEVANERSSYFGCTSNGNMSGTNYDKERVSKYTESNFRCPGAHKKFSKSSCNNFQPLGRGGSEEKVLQNEINNEQDCSNRYMPLSNSFQNVVNSDTLESVESSARSGGNTWTDHRESMVAEDRVNSFEYLPGHIYENAAIQENNSHDTGTSSVSLHQIGSSRNEYSDETDKLWNGSASSTLLRDIERGVNLMTEFVQTSNVSNSHMKKKLLKKVVEKLLKTDYPEDRLWSQSHNEGRWVSPLNSSIPETCNGRETRRSHNKELLASNKMSDRSPDYFHHGIQRAIQNESRDMRNKSIGPVQAASGNEKIHLSAESKRLSVQSSSSDVVTESGTSSAKPKSTADESVSRQMRNSTRLTATANLSKSRAQQPLGSETVNSSTSNTVTDVSQSVNSSSGRTSGASAENVREETRKKQDKLLKNTKTCGDSELLIQYLKIERENQLFWIKNEIDHLSNLKRLLETQEELKKSLTRLKNRKARSMAVNNKLLHSSPKRYTVKESSSRKNTNVKKSESGFEDRDSKTSQVSSDWSSHHYSCEPKLSQGLSTNAKENKSQKRSSLENKFLNHSKGCTADSLSRIGNKQKSVVSIEKSDISFDKDDDFEDGVCVHMRRTVGTETTDTVGVQTSKSVHQLPVIKPLWYKKQKSKRNTNCSCRKSTTCKLCDSRKSSKDDEKKPVAYYITFDDQHHQKKESTGNIIKENLNKREQQGYSLKRNIGGKDKIGSDTNESSLLSDQKENCEPTIKINANQQSLTIQDYLLRNRADYVSKAEHRRRCVAELAYLRELRDKSKRQLITLAPDSSDQSKSTTPRDLPPPPLVMKRVFSQKTMRRQTERKYRQLAEVQSRQLDMKRKEAYRTNRLMAEVFNKKLQRRTLKGEVNLSNSVSVISSL